MCTLVPSELTATVTQLAKADHPFKTLVIDTADWLEKRLAEHLCRKSNKDSIEDFGYGKGWVILTEEFARFLSSLDALLARKEPSKPAPTASGATAAASAPAPSSRDRRFG